MYDFTQIIQNLWLPLLLSVGVLEAVKKTNYLQPRFYPLAALLFGVIAGFILPGFTAVQGLVAGLVGSGIYDNIRKTLLGK